MSNIFILIYMTNLCFFLSMAAVVPLTWIAFNYPLLQLRVHGHPEDFAPELPQHHVVPEVGLVRYLLDVLLSGSILI